MATHKLVVLAGLTLATVYMLSTLTTLPTMRVENFVATFMESDATKADNDIMGVYAEVLDRQPSPFELSRQRAAFTASLKTADGLRRELRDSEEYIRMLKTQSNALAPELPKLINDRDVFDLIAFMFKLERKIEMPRNMLLPLRDVYVYFDYNNARFRAFLRLENYELLEEDIKRSAAFDKEALIEWIDENVDEKELAALTAQVQAEIDAQQQNMIAADAAARAQASAQRLDGGPASVSKHSHPHSHSNSQEGACLMPSQTASDASASGSCKPMKLYLPTVGNPLDVQPRAPICTRIGSETPVAPLQFSSRLSLTPLGEANDTEVGSILPKFDYKPFVELPCE